MQLLQISIDRVRLKQPNILLGDGQILSSSPVVLHVVFQVSANYAPATKASYFFRHLSTPGQCTKGHCP